MGLFDKKYCDVCGNKIGLLGNRKLEDGNLCKDCAAKLSPFFSDRRHSTLEEIKEQLAYREANKEKVAAFVPTRTFSSGRTILIDDAKRQFLITNSRRWQDVNPDILDFEQALGATLDVDENKYELKTKDKEGKSVSYNPPRYKTTYNFYLTIHLRSPYFEEVRFQVNDDEISVRGGRDYNRAEAEAEEIRQAILGMNRPEEPAEAVQAVKCPACGATTIPDENGRCEYCGSAVF